MYYIPKGKPMHEKLSTSFVRVEGLLEELQAQGFTGYVVMTFLQSSGYLLVRNGQVVTAVEFGDRERRFGKQIQEQLLRLAQQTKGTISVYYLTEDLVTALAGVAEGEPVYENLTSDFASLSKLVKRLANERRRYFISLTFDEQPETGGLVFIEGDRVEAACSTDAGMATGPEGLHRLIDEAEHRLAAFSVYRTREAEVPAFDEREVEISIDHLAPQVPPPSVAPQAAPPPPPAPKPAPQTTHYESLLPSGTRAAEARISFQPKPVVEEPDNILEVSEAEPTPAPASKPAGAAPTSSNGRGTPVAATVPLSQPGTTTVSEARPGAEMTDLTKLMSTVIAAVERGMTVAGRGSSFPTALRAGLLAVTEHYPFLDPFAAEFEYHDREIVFVGSAQPSEFASGLTEALRQMVEDLIYSSNGRVRDYIAEELGKVEREHTADLRRFNLYNLTERICQH